MADRLPQVFLTVLNNADDGAVAAYLNEHRVPWTSLPLGEDAFAGWLRQLATRSEPGDLALIVTGTAGYSPWPDEDIAEARRLVATMRARRVVFLDSRGNDVASIGQAANILSNIGWVERFDSTEKLFVLLPNYVAPFFNTAPEPPPPPPPRAMAAGVARSGVADVAAEFDRLGFEPYVKAVAAFLAHPQTAVPLTISIEGPWGAGKSSFMRQLERELAGQFRTIRFNAWRHEKAEELWAAFALLFVDQIKPKKRLERWRADLALARRRFDFASGWPDLVRVGLWFGTLLAATITLGTMALTVDPGELQALAGDESSTRSDILGRWFGPALGITGWLAAAGALAAMWQKFFGSVKSPLEIDLRKYLQRPDYETKLAFIERFQKDLRDVTETYLPDGRRIFVFIDDLDRCELPQAAELMRAINLMLSDSGPMVFVIGMDREKVAAALAVKHEKLLPYLSTDAPQRAAEGEVADSLRGIFFGYEFIEKFIQIPFAVPEPSELNLDTFLSSLGAPKPAAAAAGPAPAAPQPTDTSPAAGTSSSTATATPPPPAAKLHEFVKPLEDESAHLLEIGRRIAPALGNNPRRVKQFVNMFRLRVLIAFATDLFVAPADTPPPKQITLEKVAKFVAIELRWPLLIAHAEAEPALLRTLEHVACGRPVEPGSFRVAYWSRYADLMTLLRTGGDDPDWQVGELELAKLTRVSVRKPRPQEEATGTSSAAELDAAIARADRLDVEGRHEDAIALLLPLEQYAAVEPRILQRLGYHFLWSDPARAFDYSTRYVSSQPREASGYFNAACAAAQLKRREEALDLLDKSIELNPFYVKRAAELIGDDFKVLATDPRFLAMIAARR